MSQEDKNYLPKVFITTVIVIAMLFLIRPVAPFFLLGIDFKRTDIIADILKDSVNNDTISIINYEFDHTASQDTITTEPTKEPALLSSDTTITIAINDSIKTTEVVNTADSTKAVSLQKSDPKESANTHIEDYSTNKQALANLVIALNDRGNNLVRVGFIGDSFTEGDLITSDVRELLQDVYGGGGVGFVPINSHVSKFRTTIKHDFEEWNKFSLKQEGDKARQIISGHFFSPKKDNTIISYQTTSSRKHLKECYKVKFFFINTKSSHISMSINDGEPYNFNPDSSYKMQEISISSEAAIDKVSLSFENIEGLYCYGISLDSDKGIVVDNFSDRGTSGLQLAHLDPIYNSYFDILNNYYDLIVLQFGVNIISPGIYNYSSYEKSMSGVVNKLKQMYPRSSFIIMGVADRAMKAENGSYTSMKEIQAMQNAQRNIAKNCGVAFWSTYEAMGGENSMSKFVNEKLAEKDFTHINNKGGKYIAKEFVKSLLNEVATYDTAATSTKQK